MTHELIALHMLINEALPRQMTFGSLVLCNGILPAGRQAQTDR